MSYNVYLISSLGAPRNHHSIFVETDPVTSSGHIFQVVGNIQTGMSFGHRPEKGPEYWIDFVSKQLIGTVSHVNFPRIQPVVESVEPPRKQFDGPKRLYPTEPLRRCQEWTAEAIRQLKDEGVLQSATETI